jgi:hypothetical protein
MSYTIDTNLAASQVPEGFLSGFSDFLSTLFDRPKKVNIHNAQYVYKLNNLSKLMIIKKYLNLYFSLLNNTSLYVVSQ